jgi:hypothetical protein
MTGPPNQHQLTNGRASGVWVVLQRVIAVVVILIATIAFLANAAGLIGVWVIREPTRDAVTKLSIFVNEKLGIVDQALARASTRATESRQALSLVNDAASKLGDRLEESRPLLTALTDAARENLAPKIAEMRAQAIVLHDGAVSVNASLETLDTLGFTNVPTFTDELSAVSERIDAAQANVQELRAAIDEAQSGASARLVSAVTKRTIIIDNVLAQIQSTAVTYQATVAQKRQRVSEVANTVVRVITLLVLLLTALFLVNAAGQVLLIYVCWQYVRRGNFPLLKAPA